MSSIDLYSNLDSSHIEENIAYQENSVALFIDSSNSTFYNTSISQNQVQGIKGKTFYIMQSSIEFNTCMFNGNDQK